jgi:hypothetical protein
MPKDGQVWPLQLVYLVLLVLAILGFFVAPESSQSTPTVWQALSKNAWWFVLGALIAGLVLYIPVFAAWWQAGRTIGRLLKPASGSVAAWLAAVQPALEAIGDPGNPDAKPDNVIGRLEAIKAQIQAVDRADLPNSIAARVQTIQANTQAIGRPEITVSVLGRLDSIQAQIGTIGRLDLPNSVLARLQALQARAEAIGDTITPGTVLHRLAALETRLSAIEGKIDKLQRRRDDRAAERAADAGADRACGSRSAWAGFVGWPRSRTKQTRSRNAGSGSRYGHLGGQQH